ISARRNATLRLSEKAYIPSAFSNRQVAADQTSLNYRDKVNAIKTVLGATAYPNEKPRRAIAEREWLGRALGPNLARESSLEPRITTTVGWVSDANCGARGADPSHAACATKCVTQGVPIVFVSSKDKTIYKVDNQDALRDHVGHCVSITGTLTRDSLHVYKV